MCSFIPFKNYSVACALVFACCCLFFPTEGSGKKNKSNITAVFVHIPHTGGGSFNSHAVNNLGEKNCLQIKRDIYPPGLYTKDFMPILVKKSYIPSIELMEKYNFISGHFSFKDISSYLPPNKDTQYITILRHPINRAVSGDPYFKRRPEANYRLVGNLMTRSLSTVDGSLKDQLKSAKQNLKKHFFIFGLTGRYNDFLFMIANSFNWKIDQSLRHHANKRHPRKPLSPEDKKVILKHEKYDLELYEYAEMLFEEKFNKLIASKPEEYEKFLNSEHKYTNCKGTMPYILCDSGK